MPIREPAAKRVDRSSVERVEADEGDPLGVPAAAAHALRFGVPEPKVVCRRVVQVVGPYATRDVRAVIDVGVQWLHSRPRTQPVK